MKRWWIFVFSFGGAVLFLRGAEAVPSNQPPDLTEVLSVIRTNLGLSDAELNRMAVEGLVGKLHPKVQIETAAGSNEAKSSQGPLVTTNLFDKAFGYIRLRSIEPGVQSSLNSALKSLLVEPKISGLVLDLRFATGEDFKEAAQAAQLFFAEDRPLMELEGQLLQGGAKEEAFRLPLAVLVNEKTTGAAEALAAIIHKNGRGLTIGGRTAGHAFIYTEHLLSNGQKLRLASASVKDGRGGELVGTGLTPDVPVQVRLEDELGYLADAYKESGFLDEDPSSGRSAASARSRKRTEAELVRIHQEGGDLFSSSPREQPLEKVVQDPALARGLDFLKGLALAKGKK